MNTDSKPEAAAEHVHRREDRYHDHMLQHKAHVNTPVFVLTVIAALVYIVWATTKLNYEHWYATIPYLIAELICFVNLLVWSGMMIQRRDHPPHGLELEGEPPPVDVVVTCCGEPIHVIEPTLRAVSKLDYPDYKVTVADDRADPEVGKLCEELGFNHICRSQHDDRKAGNLNFALSKTRRPFILTLDADQIPHHSILNVMMGYFKVPHIGFVTSYQGFDTPHRDPWSNRDRVFYGSMQPARNASSSAISTGSGVVYRRMALDDIGGFSTWNLVEDLYSSMLMHNAGWKSVYHPFPLTHGTAPTEISSQTKQRWQWAVDSLRILFWRNPLFARGLSWRQRVNYLGFGYTYIVFGIAFPIFFILPVWGLLSGVFLMNAPAIDFVIWRGPYLVMFLLLNRLVTDHRNTRKTFRAQAGLFLTFISAIFVALGSRKHIPSYSVTRKTSELPTITQRLRHVIGHVIVVSLCLAGIIWGWWHHTSDVYIYYLNATWALWVSWLLIPYMWIALFPPKEREFRPHLEASASAAHH